MEICKRVLGEGLFIFYPNVYISMNKMTIEIDFIHTMATKCRRSMPGLLALVSANLSSEAILKPAAFPA